MSIHRNISSRLFVHALPQARSGCVQTFDQTVETGAAGSAYTLPHSPKFGRFVILRQLGTGGMGTVFAAYDEQLDRKVALMLVHSWNNEDAVQHQRTLREARALARVTHPRVISIKSGMSSARCCRSGTTTS